MSQTRPADRRPASVTLAAILLLLLGVFEVVIATTEFFRDAFGMLPPLGSNSNIYWGTLDVLYLVALLYACYALLRGQVVGWVIALIVAVLTGFRWATYVWYVPWAALIVVVVCVVIMYALAESEPYFVHG